MQQYLSHQNAGNTADGTYAALAQLYAAMQRQANLLSYMDQFRLPCGIMLCMPPLVLFLKQPPIEKKVELHAE